MLGSRGRGYSLKWPIRPGRYIKLRVGKSVMGDWFIKQNEDKTFFFFSSKSTVAAFFPVITHCCGKLSVSRRSNIRIIITLPGGGDPQNIPLKEATPSMSSTSDALKRFKGSFHANARLRRCRFSMRHYRYFPIFA